MSEDAGDSRGRLVAGRVIDGCVQPKMPWVSHASRFAGELALHLTTFPQILSRQSSRQARYDRENLDSERGLGRQVRVLWPREHRVVLAQRAKLQDVAG